MDIDVASFDDENFFMNVPVGNSRGADLRAYFEILHINCTFLFEGKEKVSREHMFADRSLPEEEIDLLWHIVLMAMTKISEVDYLRSLLEEFGLQRPGLQLEEMLAKAFLAEGVAELLSTSTISTSSTYDELLSFLRELYSCWFRYHVDVEVINIDMLIDKILNDFINEFYKTILNIHEVNGGHLASVPESFICIDKRFDKWILYFKKIEEEINDDIHYECFSINDIYIDLHALVVNKDKYTDSSNKRCFKEEFVKVDLAAHILEWSELGETEDAITTIVGHRGSGKSTFKNLFFARHALHLFEKSISTFHIPANLLDLGESVPLAISRYLRQNDGLDFNPLDIDYLENQRVLLILDGLEKIGDVGDLLQQILALCLKINRRAKHAKIQVLFIVHPEVIQINPHFFNSTSIIEILPFFPENERAKKYWPQAKSSNDSSLQIEDQRHKWWTQWTELTKNQTNYHDHLKSVGGIEGLSHWPYFNNVIATAIKSLNLGDSYTLHDLHRGLIKLVLQKIISNDKIDSSIFSLCLEEVAIWRNHGDNVANNVIGLHKQLNESDRIKQFLIDGDDISFSMAETVLVSMQIFFKVSNNKDKPLPFVLHHPLFEEYLLAERLVRSVNLVCANNNDLECNQLIREGDKVKSGTASENINETLLIWAQMTADISMDLTTFSFFRALLKDVLVNLSEKEQVHQQTLFSDLFSYVLVNNVPIDKVTGYETYQAMMAGAYNAENALIVALGAIATVTKRVSTIEICEDAPYLLGSWLMKMNGQRPDYPHTSKSAGLREEAQPPLVLRSLEYLNFAHQTLNVQNFDSARLNGSMIAGVSMSGSSFKYADLRSAQLTRSLMSDVTMNYADLRKANLDHANLTSANMVGCDLQQASLIHARLTSSNLNSVKLNHSSFSWAVLDDSLLKDTNLDDVRMNGVSMQECVFIKASLLRASLDNAIAKKSTFEQVALSDASMINGDFSNCNFLRTTFADSGLYKANFKNAHFNQCTMLDANLEGADLSNASFHKCDLSHSSLNKANLTNATFESKCNLHGASLNGAILSQVLFKGVNLKMATFEKADFQGKEKLSSNVVEAKKYAFIQCDLSGADFNQVNLSKVKMIETTLNTAVFIEATLREAELSGAMLKRAIFDRAILDEAILQDVCLEQASFYKASLKKADFKNATFTDANLHGACMDGADFQGADFSGASLFGVSLVNAELLGAEFAGANLFGANLEGARLSMDQLSDEQREQMRGVPDWVCDNDAINAFRPKYKHGEKEGLDSLTIVEVTDKKVLEVDEVNSEEELIRLKESETTSIISSSIDHSNSPTNQ